MSAINDERFFKTNFASKGQGYLPQNNFFRTNSTRIRNQNFSISSKKKEFLFKCKLCAFFTLSVLHNILHKIFFLFFSRNLFFFIICWCFFFVYDSRNNSERERQCQHKNTTRNSWLEDYHRKKIIFFLFFLFLSRCFTVNLFIFLSFHFFQILRLRFLNN